MSDDKIDNFKESVENNDFSVIDIHKLGFRLLKENKKQYALLLIKVAIVIGLFFIAFLSVVGIALSTPTSVIFTMLPMGIILTTIATATVLWLCGSTIVKINTGIDTIENKKVSSSKLKTLLRIWISCIIGACSIFLLSISYYGTTYFTYFQTGAIASYNINIFTSILSMASQIMIIFIYCYLLFVCIDIIAKGSIIKDSVKNVYRNFVYSKNKIIKKVVVGCVLIIAILLVLNVLYSLCIFIVMKTAIVNYIYMYSRVLVAFSMVVVAIILFLISVFYLQYMYLVYMLNEVEEIKEVKVTTEIAETKEVKKVKKSTIVIGSIVILVSVLFLQHSYSVYISNGAKNNRGIDMREPTEITTEITTEVVEPVGAVEAIEVK